MLLSVLIIIAAAAIIIYDSARHLTVTAYTEEAPTIPESFDGFRIVQLSDVHGAEFGKGNARLLEAVRGEKPDVIVLTGDLITSLSDLDAAQTLVNGLSHICPVFFVSGNHEYASRGMESVRDILDTAGVGYLNNRYILLEKEGESIVLAGLEDPNGPADMISPEEVSAAAASEQPGKFSILLAHRNDLPVRHPGISFGLILCGHGHGGVIRLPGVGGLLSTDRTLFPEYDAGLFHCAVGDMIVSRGLGGTFPIPRIFNRPEIVSVTLQRSE